MVLDPVQQTAPDPRLAVQLMSKRRVRQINIYEYCEHTRYSV